MKREVFLNQWMAATPGRRFYMWVRKQELPTWSLIAQIQKSYTLPHGKFIARPGRCGVVAPIVSYGNQKMEVRPGQSLQKIRVCPRALWVKSVSPYLLLTIVDCGRSLKPMMAEFIEVMTVAPRGRKPTMTASLDSVRFTIPGSMQIRWIGKRSIV